MDFKYIDEIFEDIALDLEVLKRKTQRNSILLYQHEGQLSASDSFIGNASNVNAPYFNFFKMAKEKDVDLALTPEYSCPWEMINNILDDNQLHPSLGKLWVIGCESNSLENLIQFKQKYDNEFIKIHYDNELNENGRSFIDPVVYIFKSNINREEKLIVLIQFKTCHMGVWSGGEIERNNIILGKEIYVLRNSRTPINLITLLCSEAMNFKDSLNDQTIETLDWFDKPYLILHPQFNPEPNHGNFIDFRKFVFLQDHKEIISLNWQLNSKVGGQSLLSHKNSRSGFYIKSNQLNLQSQRVNQNHNKGLYYFCNKKDKHSYILSSKPHLFLINNLPVKISVGVDSQIKRDGPEVQESFEFVNGKFKIIETVDDFQIECMNQLLCKNSFILNPANCVIDKERLVCLSTGKVHKGEKASWWHIENVESIYMDCNNEINNRITVARNDSYESIQKRGVYCEAISELQKILTKKEMLPKSIIDINDEDLKIGFSNDSIKEEFRFNVVTVDNQSVYVTLCYIGPVSEETAHEVSSTVRKLFMDSENRDIERVVIFYKQGVDIKPLPSGSFARINATHDYDDTSFLK